MHGHDNDADAANDEHTADGPDNESSSNIANEMTMLSRVDQMTMALMMSSTTRSC